jgi:hypothetical protein
VEVRKIKCPKARRTAATARAKGGGHKQRQLLKKRRTADCAASTGGDKNDILGGRYPRTKQMAGECRARHPMGEYGPNGEI